jgi:hypothetical protein
MSDREGRTIDEKREVQMQEIGRMQVSFSEMNCTHGEVGLQWKAGIRLGKLKFEIFIKLPNRDVLQIDINEFSSYGNGKAGRHEINMELTGIIYGLRIK